MTSPHILKIARMGHPILRQRAEEVSNPCSEDVQHIIADMRATIEDFGSLTGLAAPQVFISKRIVIYSISKERSRGTLTQDIPATVMINPIIDILSDEKTLDWEGCLSLPGLWGEVPRYKHIYVRYQTPTGETITHEATDFHARAIQHECDHLDGILYPQRMVDMSRFAFQEEALRYLWKHET